MQKYQLRDNDLLFAVEPNESGYFKSYVFKIHDRATEESPTAKLINHGPAKLSTAELVATIFQTGTSAEDALTMAARVTHDYGEHTFIGHTNAKQLSYELKIPLTQAAQLVACGELGRRFFRQRDTGAIFIRTAQDVYNHVREMGNFQKEHLRGLYLNMHYQIIHEEVISIGTLAANLIHPREVFKPAIEYNAAGIVLVHNHPSGVATPSKADIAITKQLVKVGHLIGINVVDHVIVTKSTFKTVDINYDGSL